MMSSCPYNICVCMRACACVKNIHCQDLLTKCSGYWINSINKELTTEVWPLYTHLDLQHISSSKTNKVKGLAYRNNQQLRKFNNCKFNRRHKGSAGIIVMMWPYDLYQNDHGGWLTRLRGIPVILMGTLMSALVNLSFSNVRRIMWLQQQHQWPL